MTREQRVIHIDEEDSIWTVNSPVKSGAGSCSSGSSSSHSSSCDSTTSSETESTTDTSTETAPEPWSRADIVQLFTLAKTGKKPWAFADALGRSTSAVQHAMRKMIIQQLIFHDAEEVAATYHMDVYDLHRILAPRKYYVPITHNPVVAAPAVVPSSSHVVPMTRSYPSWCIWAFLFMALPIIAMQPFVADFKP